MSESTQWEYHIEVIGTAFRAPKPEATEAYLNEIGEAGWEVISLHHPNNSNRIWVTMKRALTHSTRRRRSRPDDSW
jgi:hypothetical protein